MIILKLNNTLKRKIIKQVSQVLKNNGLIVYPTETCYGLAADAANSKAVDKLIKFKGFRKGKPISVAVADFSMAKQYIRLNPTAKNIFQNLLPGPITVVCQGKHKVDPRLESQTGTLGIRIPDYPLVLAIIKAFGKPITATSANISSGKTPYLINDILEKLPQSRKKLLALIIDAGPLPHRPPSTVIDTTQDQPEILRLGKIDFSQLKARTIISRSPQETRKLAENLVKKQLKELKNQCLIFALQGELGAGKTQFAKGIGKALGIKETIKSPTFTLIHEYHLPHKKVFYHIDAWRLQSPEELKQLGIKEIIKPGNIIAIEWIEKGKDFLKQITQKSQSKIVYLDFQHLSKKQRKIRFTL